MTEAVNLLKKVKVGARWQLAPLAVDRRGAYQADQVLINGVEVRHPEGTFYLDYYDNGRRCRPSVGPAFGPALTKAKLIASALAAKAQGVISGDVLAHVSEQAPGADTGMSRKLETIITEFLERAEVKRRLTTLRKYKTDSSRFLRFCQANRMTTLADIEQRRHRVMTDYERYLQQQGLADITIFHNVVNAIVLLNSAGLTNLIAKGEWPTYDRKQVSIYERKTLQTLFAHANSDDYALFQFFLQTGFRRDEVRYAMWTDVDWEKHTVSVTTKPGFRTKGGEERKVPVPARLVELLRERRKSSKGKYIFPSPHDVNEVSRSGDFLERLKELAYQAGVNCGYCASTSKPTKGKPCSEGAWCEKFNLHKFRHTYGTTMANEAHVPLPVLMKYMGHKQVQTTMRYQNPALDASQAALIESGPLAAMV